MKNWGMGMGKGIAGLMALASATMLSGAAWASTVGQPTPGGITSANSTAVTKTASLTGSPRLRQKSHSSKNPHTQQNAIIASERQPK